MEKHLLIEGPMPLLIVVEGHYRGVKENPN